MNEQRAPGGIEWCRVYGRPGYTWNPVTGCAHECRWKMPDGSVAICYAEEITRKFDRGDFKNVTFHPTRLAEPFKAHEPSGIFCCSMSDLMGLDVTNGQIERVLEVMRQTPQHIYFILTKNAPRLSQFDFPGNVWVGASSPPDWMYGKALSQGQQAVMLRHTLDILQGIRASVRWISFEPLSWDCSNIVNHYGGAIQWAVIGAASNGSQYYAPRQTDLLSLLYVLDNQDVPVFYKGNLASLPFAANNWREDYPAPVLPVGKQLSLFEDIS